MEQIVLVSESVVVYMNNLVQELYDAEYFSYKESARDYVNKLYDFIYNDLPHNTHYKTPEELKHYGNYYVKLKSSRRTMWYVFFDKSNNYHLVEFITTNHTPQSAYLNKL